MNAKQQAYRDELGRQYVDDAQGFLCAEVHAMLRGKLLLEITEDHQAAVKTEVKARLGGLFKTQEAF